MSPAHRVVIKVGGVKRLVELSGRGRTTVYRWLEPGQYVPIPAQRAIIERARIKGITLTFADFLPEEEQAVAA